MRPIKLLPALAAAAIVPAFASAGAWAHPAGLHPRVHKGASSTSCHLSIEVSSRHITAGESVSVFGALRCPNPANAAGQAVTLYQHTAGTGGFTAVGTPATTEANGSYQFTPPVFLANSVFYVRSGPAQSPSRTVKVSPVVTLASPAENTQLFTGIGGVKPRMIHRYRFSGVVSPTQVGATVVLQRATANEDWHRIALGRVGAGGAYSIEHTFGLPGDATLRVLVRRFANNSAGASPPVSYTVSQPQNPNLTIESSADPISYGQSATIHGAVAGGAGQAVTLLAKTAGGKLITAASGKADGSGNYAFPVTPLQNTFYRVASGKTKSTFLFQGVRYSLSANASATTVQAGQALIFSGTVSPAVAGHAVYLQRKGPLGLGYFVVDVGTVGAGGAYSISHTFFNGGSGEYRVRVPGDPGHQGSAASTAFKITVTPTPAALLHPGHVRLPKEGQT